MALSLAKEEYYTFADWLALDESVRAELYDGILVMMAPPSQKHQIVLLALAAQLRDFLKGKPCTVIPAPTGVRLSQKEDSALEPDIIVVCDKSKLDGHICNGAPDLIVEILSPSTARYDRMVKFQKYQQAGVREYWIVDPDTATVQVNINENGRYYSNVYGDTDAVPVHVLEGCTIQMREVFAE
jgi:Uma2 family endonuclease